MTLASGRDFTYADREGTPPVVIVNETAARRWWPNQDAVGKTVLQQEGRPGTPGPVTTLTVIAVAKDSKYRDLGEQPRMFVYVPGQQQYLPRTTIVARSTEGQRLAGDLRRLLAQMNPNLPIVQSQTLEDYAALTRPPRVAHRYRSLGLLSPARGDRHLGVTAYMVSSRTRSVSARAATARRRPHGPGGNDAGVGWHGHRSARPAPAGYRLALFGINPTDPIAFGGSAVLFWCGSVDRVLRARPARDSGRCVEGRKYSRAELTNCWRPWRKLRPCAHQQGWWPRPSLLLRHWRPNLRRRPARRGSGLTRRSQGGPCRLPV